MLNRLSQMVLLLLLLSACSSVVVNQDPTGQIFPSVRGTSLAGESYMLPDDFAGKPLVLLVGYKQRSQFDLDRWILGLVQLQTPVRIVELPTIKGLIPGMFANRIDEGMRNGIPEEDWGAVITVYDEAAPIVAFTGNENGSNGRVMLLDKAGKVIWFADQGYSAGQVKSLDAAVRALSSEQVQN
jgi:hypothetical protein